MKRRIKDGVYASVILVLLTFASVLSFAPLPFASATTLFSDDFESGNLNKWANFGTTTSPPAGVALDTVTKYNGTASLAVSNSSDFWNNQTFTYANDFAVTFKMRANNSLPAFWQTLIYDTDADQNDAFSVWGGCTSGGIMYLQIGVWVNGTAVPVPCTDIPTSSIKNKWQDIRINFHNDTSGVFMLLYVNNTLKTYVNVSLATGDSTLRMRQQITRLETANFAGNLDNLLIYSIGDISNETITTTVTSTVTSTTTVTTTTTVATTTTITVTSTITTTVTTTSTLTFTDTSTVTTTVTSTVSRTTIKFVGI